MTSPDDIIVLLRKQLASYQRLERLAGEQSRAILDGDHNTLLSVLERRKAITAEAVEQDALVAPFRADWPDAAADWEPTERDVAAELFASIRDVLASLAKQDDRDAAGLRVRMATADHERQRVKLDGEKVRRVNRRYAMEAYRAERSTKPRGPSRVSA
jgi:hypothetical protein